MVIVSIVLAGVGVDAERLEEVGWSPMPPVRMRRIREALALRLDAPDVDRA